MADLLTIYQYCMEMVPSIIAGKGKKRIVHFLMEYRNIPVLNQLIALLPPEVPVCLIVDEADMNRATETKKEEDEDGNEVEGTIPPITRGILLAKNLLRKKNNGSKTVLVTATPQGIMCSERDDQRVVIYEPAFLGHNGPGDGKDANIELVPCIARQRCKTGDRWTGSEEDQKNTYYEAIHQSVRRLEDMGTKDASVKQVMLISLEGINDVQDRLELVVKRTIRREMRSAIDVIVFNGDTSRKESKEQVELADRIRNSSARKIIVIAGFRASRGVSFTDFSDKSNQFECVIQVHASKTGDPLNSCLQAMRIVGPPRRTITRAILYCNVVTYEDMRRNFREMYRICRELAEGANVIYTGAFKEGRMFTQASNFHYIKRSNRYGCLLEVSSDPKDHEPITTM